MRPETLNAVPDPAGDGSSHERTVPQLDPQRWGGQLERMESPYRDDAKEEREPLGFRAPAVQVVHDRQG